MSAMCRRCRVKKANRPRGLCWTCYHTPGAIDLFPSTSKFAYCEVTDFYGKVKPPPVPTNALPGSDEKVAVMAERASGFFSLFHPSDNSGREECA